jgi:hypothetical protein
MSIIIIIIMGTIIIIIIIMGTIIIVAIVFTMVVVAMVVAAMPLPSCAHVWGMYRAAVVSHVTRGIGL